RQEHRRGMVLVSSSRHGPDPTIVSPRTNWKANVSHSGQEAEKDRRLPPILPRESYRCSGPRTAVPGRRATIGRSPCFGVNSGEASTYRLQRVSFSTRIGMMALRVVLGPFTAGRPSLAMRPYAVVSVGPVVRIVPGPFFPCFLTWP